MGKIFLMHIEDTKLEHRIDLFDWICSPAIGMGKPNDKFWIVRTDTQIHNQYGDIDVFNFMHLLQRAHQAGYQSLLIMKHGINRAADSKVSEPESVDRSPESQQTDTPPVGEVPTGEPRAEVSTGTSDSGNSGEGESSSNTTSI